MTPDWSLCGRRGVERRGESIGPRAVPGRRSRLDSASELEFEHVAIDRAFVGSGFVPDVVVDDNDSSCLNKELKFFVNFKRKWF